jgi:hypothetical protein
VRATEPDGLAHREAAGHHAVVKRRLGDARRLRPVRERLGDPLDLEELVDLARLGDGLEGRDDGLLASLVRFLGVTGVDRVEDAVGEIVTLYGGVDRLGDARVGVPQELRDQLDRHREIDHPLPARAPQVVRRDGLDSRGDARRLQLLEHAVQVAKELLTAAFRVAGGVRKEKLLLVGHRRHGVVAVDVLGAANQHVVAALKVVGDVGAEGVLEAAQLGSGGE